MPIRSRRNNNPSTASQTSLLPPTRVQGVQQGVPLDRIDIPWGQELDEDFLNNVRDFGILEPVLLHEEHMPAAPPFYSVIDGRRRVRAAANIDGLETIPAIVYSDTPWHVISGMRLSANLHRASNPLSELGAIERLQSEGHTVESIVRQLGLSERVVRNRLRLHTLTPELRSFLTDGLITLRQAMRVAAWNRIYQDMVGRQIENMSDRVTNEFLDSIDPNQAPADTQQPLALNDATPVQSIDWFRGVVTAAGVIQIITDAHGEVTIHRNGEIVVPRSTVVPAPVQLSVTLDEAMRMETWEAVVAILDHARRAVPVEPDDRVDQWYADIETLLTQARSLAAGGNGRPASETQAPTPPENSAAATRRQRPRRARATPGRAQPIPDSTTINWDDAINFLPPNPTT